jgi:hypothetical protein
MNIFKLLKPKDPTDLSADRFSIQFAKPWEDYYEQRLIFQMQREFGAEVRSKRSTAPGYSQYERELVFSFSARDLDQKFNLIKQWMKAYRQVGKFIVTRKSSY